MAQAGGPPPPRIWTMNIWKGLRLEARQKLQRIRPPESWARPARIWREPRRSGGASGGAGAVRDRRKGRNAMRPCHWAPPGRLLPSSPPLAGICWWIPAVSELRRRCGSSAGGSD